MMQPRDEAEIALLLTARLTASDGVPPLTTREFWNVRKRVPDLRQLIGASAKAVRALLQGEVALAERITRLVDSQEAFDTERKRLADDGLELCSAIGETFPDRLRQRLGDACPPVLLVAGLRSLMSRSSLGVVGSRSVSEEGTSVARSAGHAAALRGFTLVSGAAKGVDSIAMLAALSAGGTSIAVPSEGLRRVLKRRDADLSHSLYLSPFSPHAAFTAGNAMSRNKLIYALADKTLVVASDDGKGGTWQGATEAIRRGFGPVAVWRGEGEGPGNEGLERRGCHRADDIAELFNEPPQLRHAQLGLDLY